MLGVNEREETLIKQMESISVAINKPMEETIAQIHALLRVMEDGSDYSLTTIRMAFLSQYSAKYGELPEIVSIPDPETSYVTSKTVIVIKGEHHGQVRAAGVIAPQFNEICRQYALLYGDGSAPPQGVMVKRSQTIVYRPDLAEATQGQYATPVTLPIRRSTPNLRRNLPCPCGSGKKYKACCRGV